MDEAPNMYTNLNDQQQFRLNKINVDKDYSLAETRERRLLSERLSKYNASFVYFDKYLFVFSATSGAISTVFICFCYWSTCRNSKYYS